MPVFGAQDGRYAAIVIDESSGQVLHAENADSIRHPASLAKKMTLYILFKALRNKQISLNTRFTTSYLATQQIPCKLGLKVGDTIDVRSIIEALITISSNDVAIVVAEGLAGSLKKFVALMNKTAKELGLKNTRFYNPSGVPDARQITTARDMATLGMALYHRFPEYYPYFKKKHIHYHGVLRRAHNHMLESFPNSDGLKTGFVNASGFNITTSAFRYDQNNRKRRLFVVVMGGQSWRSRDQRAALLLEEGFRKINATNLGPSSPLKPSPKSKARSDDASPHLQAVSYSTTKEAFDRNLRQVSQDSSPPTMPPSAVNNAQLLDASLKKTVYEDKPRAVKGASNFPNIIQPIHSPANETAKLRPVSYSFSPEDEAQRTLPPGWVKASAPHTPKKVMAKVHLKKRA
jgi:D-alanyl-D-alanine carboxypeptidase